MVINDGHHRYESALTYRDEMRAKGDWTEDSAFNFHMCYMVPVQDEGLVVCQLIDYLKMQKLLQLFWKNSNVTSQLPNLAPNVEALDAYLESHINEHAFCVYDGKNAWGLTMKHEDSVYQFVNAHTSKETKIFDVVILRDIVFKTILNTGELKD